MKVALLIPGFCLSGRGGAEKGAALLANLLVRNGIGADIICYARDFHGPSYPLEEAVGIKPIGINSDRAIEALRGERYDALVGYAMRGILLRIARIKEILDVPLLLQECNSPQFITASLYWHSENGCRTLKDAFWLRQAFLAHAAAVRFNHPAFAESVVGDIRPFTYAFCNASGRAMRDLKTDPGPQSNGRKLVCVGAFRHPVKNGPAAVRAFCEFSTANPGWSLHLYGKNGFVAEIAQLRANFPSANIIEHGVVTNIDEIYRDAHAAIIPSYTEGLPNVLIESFSYGVPCIGYADCSGVRETIVHGVNGLLADRADPTGLAKALRDLSDANLRNELGQNARRYALEHFSQEKWNETWLRMVQNAVDTLNNQNAPQFPAAYDMGHPRQFAWSALLRSHVATHSERLQATLGSPQEPNTE
jgi:glycosyltransferase involved in cell wall biosynthesis